MDHAQGLGLRDHLGILRRRLGWIVALVVLTVGAAAGVTARQTPIYESTAEVLVQPLRTLGQTTALEQVVIGGQDMSTQQRLVLSGPVVERVAERLDTDPSTLPERIEVSRVGDTTILAITARHPDRRVAAELAQGFAETYFVVRQEVAARRVDTSLAGLREQADVLRSRIEEVDSELASLRADSEEGSLAAGREAQLQQERDTLFTQLGQVTAQSASFETIAGWAEGGEIIKPAVVPEAPVAPLPVRNALLALVLGLVLGLAVAYGMDQLDDAVRSDDDVKRATGRPVLAPVPHWRGGKKTGQLASVADPWSPAAEAYRTLRTNIRFLTSAELQEGDWSAGASVVVTSATTTEGKTTTAANLAVAAARAGSRVLLVEADLRQPDLRKVFGVAATHGLSDLLVDEGEVTDALVDVGVPNLRVMLSGPVPPNPTELLASPRMRRLMGELERLADLVVYDTPPVLAVADPLEIAPSATCTVLVANAGVSHRRALRAAAERLAGIDVNLGGCVLNNVASGESYYGYDSYPGYEPQPERTAAGVSQPSS